MIVRGNFNLLSPGILRFHIFNHEKAAIVNVKAAAVFAGTLQAGAEKVGKLSASDNSTVLTAGKIIGQFSNVASVGTPPGDASFDQFGAPIGDSVGTFRAIYNKSSVVLSDFRPN